ncbi:MAG: uroporphyrinogen decarboxylase family protein [Actinomycetota bacterium]
MQSSQRVRAALALDVADRPPAGWWGHTFKEEWSPQDLAAVTAARARRYNWDFVKLQPRACCFAEAFGSTYRSAEGFRTAPVLERQAVNDIADWEAVGETDASAPSLADQVEALRIVAADLGPGVPVLQTVFSPVTVAGYLVGKDRRRLLSDMLAAPGPTTAALEAITAALIDFSKKSIEAGAAGIFYAVSGYATAGVMDLPQYEEIAAGYDRQVLGSLAEDAWFNVLHLCGSAVHFELAKTLQAQAVSWSDHDPDNPSLAEGSQISGKAVMGGIDHATALLKSSAAEILRQGQAAVAETGGKGLLLAPGCSVPTESPEENLEAIGAAVS